MQRHALAGGKFVRRGDRRAVRVADHGITAIENPFKGQGFEHPSRMFDPPRLLFEGKPSGAGQAFDAKGQGFALDINNLSGADQSRGDGGKACLPPGQTLFERAAEPVADDNQTRTTTAPGVFRWSDDDTPPDAQPFYWLQLVSDAGAVDVAVAGVHTPMSVTYLPIVAQQP